jgi:putative transposase
VVVAGALADLARSKGERVAEHALLRQHLVVLKRSAKRPRCTAADRTLLVLLASRVRAWRQAVPIVPPDTLLRGHRPLFCGFWRRKSRGAPRARLAKVSAETIALIREMTAANRLWGAERIRGELAKLDIHVATWAVQKYLRDARPPPRAGQTGATFRRNHAGAIWACDFLPVTDRLFRPLYAYFIVALATRRVVHAGATRHPTDAWVAQQRRAATPFDERPRFLIRDNDGKDRPRFDHLASASGIRVLCTPVRTPRANGTCERFRGSVRRECLDHGLGPRRGAPAARAPRVCRVLQARPAPPRDRSGDPCESKPGRATKGGHRAYTRPPHPG